NNSQSDPAPVARRCDNALPIRKYLAMAPHLSGSGEHDLPFSWQSNSHALKHANVSKSQEEKSGKALPVPARRPHVWLNDSGLLFALDRPALKKSNLDRRHSLATLLHSLQFKRMRFRFP